MVLDSEKVILNSSIIQQLKRGNKDDKHNKNGITNEREFWRNGS